MNAKNVNFQSPLELKRATGQKGHTKDRHSLCARHLASNRPPPLCFLLCSLLGAVHQSSEHVLASFHDVTSLWLPSSIQVMMKCGRASILGDQFTPDNTHTQTAATLLHLSTSPRTRTRPPAQRRPLTVALCPQTTMHWFGPREPHASPTQRAPLAWRRAPDVAHLLSLRVVWSWVRCV